MKECDSEIVVEWRRAGFSTEEELDRVFDEARRLFSGLPASRFRIHVDWRYDTLCPLCRAPYHPDSYFPDRCATCGETLGERG